MDALKALPIRYKGELHEVKLINFSVPMKEVRPLVPKQIKIRDFGGRAIISMVNVKLKRMRPGFVAGMLGFNYQHIGFRLLVDDADLNDGDQKGIFFIRSFTSKPFLIWAGGKLTDYKLEHAQIDELKKFRLRQGDRFLEYELNEEQVIEHDESLKEMIQAIDRAYAVRAGHLVKTQIVREKWPIKWVKCLNFSTNFFRSAKFLGAFKVDEVIHYHWLSPESLN